MSTRRGSKVTPTTTVTYRGAEKVKSLVEKGVIGGMYWLNIRSWLRGLGLPIMCAVNLFLVPSVTAVHFDPIAPIYFMCVYVVFLALDLITLLIHSCKAKMWHNMSWSCLEWCGRPDEEEEDDTTETAVMMSNGNGSSGDATKSIVTIVECHYVMHWQNSFFRKIWATNLIYLVLEIFFTAGYIVVWLGHEPGLNLLNTAKGYQQVTLWFILLGASMFIELWLFGLVWSEYICFMALRKYQHKYLPEPPQAPRQDA